MAPMISGWLSLAALVALGMVAMRRSLLLESWTELLILGSSLGISLALLFVNAFLRLGLAMGPAIRAAGVLALVLSLLVILYRDPRLPALERPSLKSALAVIFGALVVWTLTNAYQLERVDNDYWLHAPLQAHMLRGSFPPSNPYFAALPLGGHYGRDLLIVMVARLGPTDLIRSQWLVTSVTQVLAMLVLGVLAARFGRNRAAVILVPAFMALGVNMGYMSGLLQFFENNGSPVTLLVALVFFLLLDLWRCPSGGRALLLGLVLGSFAVLYETHFGLVMLAGASVALARWRWYPEPSARVPVRGLKLLGAAYILALILACTLGGAFTDLVSRHLLRHSTTGELSMAVMNQSQRASLRFPKPDFFCLRVARGESPMPSCLYAVWPMSSIYAAIDHEGARSTETYVPLWSWTVVRMHGLGLLLAPFTLLLLWWRRHELGLLLFAFGLWSYIIPGLVDFGPIHEWEYFRWEFAASLGLAGALAVALGELIELVGYHSRARQGVAIAAVAGFTLLNLLPGLRMSRDVLSRAHDGAGLRAAFTLSGGTVDWLRRHSGHLHLRDGDVEAFLWLAPRVERGQRVLVNFAEQDAWEILFESALGNITGLYAVGHELPRDTDPIGLPPFRMQGAYRTFLLAPSQAGLETLGLDWIYLRLPLDRQAELEIYERLPGLERVFDWTSPGGLVVVYRVRPIPQGTRGEEGRVGRKSAP